MKTTIMLAAVATWLVTVGPARANPLTEGEAAYRRAQYSVAANKLLPLARHGSSQAQALLGFMYEYGRGVIQNAVIAAQLYQCAADQGHPMAQYQLGLMYDKGHGVPRSAVQAYVLLNLAAARVRAGEREYYVRIRNAVAAKLNLAQIAEGQRLASMWAPTPAHCLIIPSH